MSRKFSKAVLLAMFTAVVLATTAVLWAAAAKDIPMIAFFSADPSNKIFGDSSMPYVHQGTTLGVNNLTISGREGYFVMAIYANSGRYANLLFDTRRTFPDVTNPVECANAYFLDTPVIPVQTTYWFLRTYWRCRYIPHEEPDGTTWTELIRSTTRKDATILNLKAMVPGETVGVSVEMMKFRPRDSGLTPGYDESQDLYGLTGKQLDPEAPGSAAYLLVTATDWNGDGVMDWILRTIPGKVVIKQYGRADDVLPHGDGFLMTCGYPCEYGSFSLPFELKIAKK